jgi:fatty acid desaturase
MTDTEEGAALWRGAAPAIEWPTVALVAATYAAWALLTYAYAAGPRVAIGAAIAVLLTLHSSLQHEILHGHPTRSKALNRLLGIVPLSLWISYDRYRESHLIHHINDRLTDPIDDPESFYFRPEDWARSSGPLKALIWVQQTLAGRILVGPFYRIAVYLCAEGRLVIADAPGVRRAWAVHLALCVPVVYWVVAVCHIPIWVYVLGMVMPGYSLLLVRSFAEHRAYAEVPKRTALVERSWILGPLFLFNNLHALHHREPLIPWYAYPARYREARSRLLEENGHLLYVTYFDVARRFLLLPHDQPVHPQGRAPRAR